MSASRVCKRGHEYVPGATRRPGCPECYRARMRVANLSPRALAAQHERDRERNAERNPRRILIGDSFYGYARTVEEADAILAHLRRKIDDFRERQRIEGARYRDETKDKLLAMLDVEEAA